MSFDLPKPAYNYRLYLNFMLQIIPPNREPYMNSSVCTITTKLYEKVISSYITSVSSSYCTVVLVTSFL
jgi:hypothetical protein